MPVTRRGLFGLIGGGGPPLIAEMIAARGMEAAQAGDQGAQTQTQTQTQGGRGGRQGGAGRGGGQGQGRGQRPAPPEGISEIRISSNENALGPGKTVLDAIVNQLDRKSTRLNSSH